MLKKDLEKILMEMPSMENDGCGCCATNFNYCPFCSASGEFLLKDLNHDKDCPLKEFYEKTNKTAP